MSFPRYPKYKTSGVEWLGDVPEHWDVRRVRWLCEIRKRIAGVLGHDVLSITQQGVKVKDTESNDGQLSMDYSKYQLVDIGDFAMNHMDLLTGYVDISPVNGVTSPDYRVFTIRNRTRCNDHYLLYLFQMGYRNKIFYAYGQGSSQLGRWRLPTEQFKDLSFPLPLIEEQITIAAFLDHETAKIDELVAEQERLIELLKEKRQAVISHAVTKGLNPDAPMKDSGIEWLGEVPEHWEVCDLNYALSAIGDIDHYMPESVDKGVPYVMTGDLTDFASGIDFESCKQVSHNDYLKLSKRIKSSKGDVVMARYATIGTASFIDVDREFLVSYSCVTIKPNPSKALGLYIFNYFKSLVFFQGIQQQVNTNTQGNVGVNDLKKIKVTLPNLTEQAEIIEYLAFETAKFTTLTTEANHVIDLLKERRTALISAAVTGQIDVRNLVSIESA